MVTLAQFIMWFMLAWLAALAAVVLLRALGDGRLGQLLCTTAPAGGTGELDPERVQLMVVSLGVIGYYFIRGIQAAAAGPVEALPEASAALTAVFAGSNTLYLSGKLLRHSPRGTAQR